MPSQRDHHRIPFQYVIGNLAEERRIRSSQRRMSNIAFVYLHEPKNINEALEDESWIIAMQEELNQFERNKV